MRARAEPGPDSVVRSRFVFTAALLRDTTQLRHAGRDAFSDGYVLVVFRRDAAGRVTGFDASTPRTMNVAFVRER
jgi:hypothetical protein